MKQTFKFAFSQATRAVGESFNRIFPRFCSICHSPESLMGNDNICNRCWKTLHAPKQTILPNRSRCYIFSAAKYENDFKQMMILAKFKRDLASIQILIALIRETFDRIPHDIQVITSVPSHYFRTLWRGIDLPGVLAYELSKSTNIPYDPSILRRIKSSPRHTKRDQTQRQQNLHGVFRANANAAGKSILVIDDVMTTGSTILACYKALQKQKPSEVVFLTAGKT